MQINLDLNPISYITAYNSGIKMIREDGSTGGWGKTPSHIAYILKTLGMASEIYGSSTMDFATEEGFASDDGAQMLFKKALELV